VTLPALPPPAAITPAEVDEYAVAVERFADDCDDIAAVTDTKNRWAAITEYIRRTSRDGVNRAEVAMRHLEQRVGLLIKAKREAGELATAHRPSGSVEVSTLPNIGLDRHDAAEFVAMAEHPEVVEAVIAESSDDAPATRNKVRTAIREHKQRQVESQAEQDLAVEIEQRGLRTLTDPAEIAAMRRREEVLAEFHGSVCEILRFRDTYPTAELLEYGATDRLWPQTISDARTAAQFLLSITEVNT
jgi:hypothetical protein